MCVNLKIKSKKIILELPTHLSFPCILREAGNIYIYPESAYSGKLDVYEYDSTTETATYFKESNSSFIEYILLSRAFPYWIVQWNLIS